MILCCMPTTLLNTLSRTGERVQGQVLGLGKMLSRPSMEIVYEGEHSEATPRICSWNDRPCEYPI